MYDTSVEKNVELYGNNISNDILSKVGIDSAFEKTLKQAAAGLDIGAIYGNFDDALATFDTTNFQNILRRLTLLLKICAKDLVRYRQGQILFLLGKIFLPVKLEHMPRKIVNKIYTSMTPQGTVQTVMDETNSYLLTYDCCRKSSTCQRAGKLALILKRVWLFM